MENVGVNTIFGKLYAEVSGEPNYPGIVINIEQENGEGKYDKQLALIECTPDKPADGGHSLRLLVWASPAEDYTDSFTLIEKKPDGEAPEIIWEKYLQYLCSWSKRHKSTGFYGMTPACFEEWRSLEYGD